MSLLSDWCIGWDATRSGTCCAMMARYYLYSNDLVNLRNCHTDLRIVHSATLTSYHKAKLLLETVNCEGEPEPVTPCIALCMNWAWLILATVIV